MSMNRALVIVIAMSAGAWLLRGHKAPAPPRGTGSPRPTEPAPPSQPGGPSGSPGPAPSAPALPEDSKDSKDSKEEAKEQEDIEPFRGHDFVVTTDTPDGPPVVLRSALRTGRDLALELGFGQPLPAGQRVFATVSVSDELGNTVLDCTWRDVELTGDDAHRLDCQLPADVHGPLTISGHQRSGPSFVEAPTVVAIDPGVRQ
jgi:hypothetical protein